MLEAQARFDSTIPAIFVRVGQVGGEYDSPYCWLDLGDASGKAIRISADGWRVVDRPGVNFRRPEGLLPLPMPVRDGSIELLRRYVNLTEPDFRLLITCRTSSDTRAPR
jgi:putative DNA primase/helicase